MYIVIVWEKQAGAQQTASEEASKKMRQILEPTSWVRPMANNFYLVRTSSAEKRDQLKEQLIEVCRANPGTLHLAVSPVLPDGSWTGWLPKDMWDKVGRRTKLS
jgi:hypothetical protein